MAQTPNLKECQTTQAITDIDQTSIITNELMNIKGSVEEIRGAFLEIIDIRIEEGSKLIHTAIREIMNKFKFISKKYLYMHRCLDKIFHLLNPSLSLPMPLGGETKKLLLHSITLALGVHSKLYKEKEDHEQKQTKIHHQYPIRRTEQGYKEAVRRGWQSDIDNWETKVMQANSAVHNLVALKDLGKALNEMETQVSKVEEFMPKFDAFIRTNNEFFKEAQSSTAKRKR